MCVCVCACVRACVRVCVRVGRDACAREYTSNGNSSIFYKFKIKHFRGLKPKTKEATSTGNLLLSDRRCL